MSAREPRIVIVGGGFGGVAAAIELQRHGFRDLLILEAASGLGGTWLHNSYPGAACDVPSHLYSFSYAQRRDWSRLCSPQPEILSYLRAVASSHGVDHLLVPNTAVDSCVWDEKLHRWTLTSSDGRSWEAEAVVLATGQLHKPAFPRVSGKEDFGGHSFHSARWDHEYDLRGKRVAVIGTGASAVQFVPEIAAAVERLVVFQRTGNWFMARKNRAYPGVYRWLIEKVPGLQVLRRAFWYHYGESLTLMIRHPRGLGRVGRLASSSFMRSQIKDPAMRAKLVPDYTFGCKRVLFSSRFLPALQRENVELVTDPITHLSPDGVVTQDGRERTVDCVIYGTGFHTNDFMLPMEVVGVGDRTLREAWAAGPHAHLGVTVPGFPSMFLMYGPNTNTSGGSIIFYLETQAAYLRQALAYLRERNAAALDVRRDVEEASDRETQARFIGTAWTRCDSWYRDAHGRIVANWPGYMREYEARLREFDPTEYRLVDAGVSEPAPA